MHNSRKLAPGHTKVRAPIIIPALEMPLYSVQVCVTATVSAQPACLTCMNATSKGTAWLPAEPTASRSRTVLCAVQEDEEMASSAQLLPGHSTLAEYQLPWARAP